MGLFCSSQWNMENQGIFSFTHFKAKYDVYTSSIFHALVPLLKTLHSPIFRFIDTIFNFTSITSGFTNLFNDSTLLTYAGVAILAIVLFGNLNLISSNYALQSNSTWILFWDFTHIKIKWCLEKWQLLFSKAEKILTTRISEALAGLRNPRMDFTARSWWHIAWCGRKVTI